MKRRALLEVEYDVVVHPVTKHLRIPTADTWEQVWGGAGIKVRRVIVREDEAR